METITLKEVIQIMDGGQPFSLKAITCNKKDKSGGEELVLSNAKKHNPLRPSEQRSIAAAQPSSSLRKNPNHFNNSTRNVILQNGEIRKVHIRLIRQFNGKTVL